jgi:3-phytase
VPLAFGTTKKINSKTAYGLAAWKTGGEAQVFVSQENTTNLARFKLTDAGSGAVSYQKQLTYSFPDTFTLPGGSSWSPCFNPAKPDWKPHVEGMVVDPATGTLWADQELVGLWKLTTDLGSPQLLHRLTRFGQPWTVNNGKCVINTGATSYGDPYLPGDLEGIGLYQAGSGGYLIMSNQNASLFTVFDRNGGAYRGSFKVAKTSTIDAVDATDGVAITNVPLGSSLPSGVVITQDGKNTPETGTDFKFTAWPAIASALNLTTDTSGNPRA